MTLQGSSSVFRERGESVLGVIHHELSKHPWDDFLILFIIIVVVIILWFIVVYENGRREAVSGLAMNSSTHNSESQQLVRALKLSVASL